MSTQTLIKETDRLPLCPTLESYSLFLAETDDSGGAHLTEFLHYPRFYTDRLCMLIQGRVLWPPEPVCFIIYVTNEDIYKVPTYIPRDCPSSCTWRIRSHTLHLEPSRAVKGTMGDLSHWTKPLDSKDWESVRAPYRGVKRSKGHLLLPEKHLWAHCLIG